MRTERIIYTVIEVIFDIIAILLAARIILRFFGANPATPFVNWLYETTGSLIAPFSGIFPNPALEGRFVIDVAAVVALVVYSIIGYAVLSFIADIRERAVVRKHK